MLGVGSRLRGWLRTKVIKPSDTDDSDHSRPHFDTSAEIDTETLAEILTNTRRNLVIAIVGSHTRERVRLNELAHTVAMNMNYYDRDDETVDPQADNPSDTQVKNVRDSLRRHHLPRLEEYGIVEVDEDEEAGVTVVSRGENADAALFALDDLADYCTPKGDY